MLPLLLATLVSISPPLGLSPLKITIRATITTPTEAWYCPSIEVTWVDGTRSARQSDCPPWDEVEDFYWVERFEKTLGPGVHTIKVRLKQGKKEELHTLKIEVH